MNWSDYFLPKGQWLNLSGRINRQKYFAHLMLCILVSLPVVFVLWPFNPIYDHPILLTVLAGNLMVVLGGLLACLFAKRLHDLGLPAIIVIPMLIGMPVGFVSYIFTYFESVPIWLNVTLEAIQKLSSTLNTGIGFYLLLAPGERGPNKYGPDPLPAKDILLLETVDGVNPK